MKKRLLTNEDYAYLEYSAGCKVSFTEEQELTDEQKEIARKNIGIDELPTGGGGSDSGENTGGGSGTPGEDGFSPIAKVTQTTTGAQITITDKTGTTTATVNHGKDGQDGQDGQNGYTPQKGVDYFDGADGKDGKDGVSPKVSVSKIGKTTTITITDAEGTKTATIKDGEDGASGGGTGGTGADGEDGIGIASIVQTTKSAEDDGINILTITLTDGSTHSFEVQNGSKGSDGKDGQDGSNGKDGYTPVKGTDYFDGEDGQPGADGYSPTAKVEQTSTGAKITITDKSGTTTATVENGTDGTDGQDGADGADGVTFTPSVSSDGVISWTNNGGLENPASVDMKKNNHAPIVSTTASRTLAAGNESSFLYCTNSSAITITIPANVFAVGTEIEVSRCGAGTVTFAAASGVTINSVDSAKTIANRYGVAVLKQVASNVWLLAGDLG